MIALFIGRFQPLHNGHAAVIREIALEYDIMKIGIGSSQFSNTKDNPLSAQERKEMIQAFLKEEKITNAEIYNISDINNDALWVQHVKKIVGEFGIVYSGNPWVINLFKGKDMQIKKIKEIHPYKATRTRTAVRQDKEIVQDVPAVVLKYLKKIDALERIRVLQ